MAQYDLESFRDEFLTLFQTEMAAKITAINTEKGAVSGDLDYLTDFTSDQYIADMNEKVMNYESFVFYSWPSVVTTESFAGKYSLEVTMAFEVVFTDMEGGEIANNKILRYTRAMAEIVIEYANKRSSQISNLELSILAPTPIQLNQETPVWKVGGISIKGVITS